MTQKNYYRIMLGKKSVHAEECLKGNFIGTDFDVSIDLTGKLPENWKIFNQNFIPLYLKTHPDKKKISAGLACGALWTVSKGINAGDIVLCPDGRGGYLVGEVLDDYFYQAGGILPHRRKVRWNSKKIQRAQMSVALQNSTGSIGTVSTISRFSDEIESLISGNESTALVSRDPSIEDPSMFALEKLDCAPETGHLSS